MYFLLVYFAGAGIATGWMIGGSNPGRGWEFFSSPPCPERLWSPPILLSKGYQGLFRWGWNGRGVKLTTHLQLVPRSRMSGAISPLPQYVFIAWWSVKSTGTTLPFTLACLSYFFPFRGRMFLLNKICHRILKSPINKEMHGKRTALCRVMHNVIISPALDLYRQQIDIKIPYEV
jgi:hypothetical protein